MRSSKLASCCGFEETKCKLMYNDRLTFWSFQTLKNSWTWVLLFTKYKETESYVKTHVLSTRWEQAYRSKNTSLTLRLLQENDKTFHFPFSKSKSFWQWSLFWMFLLRAQRVFSALHEQNLAFILGTDNFRSYTWTRDCHLKESLFASANIRLNDAWFWSGIETKKPESFGWVLTRACTHLS